MVQAVATEYVEPYSEPQRIAKARMQIFEQLTAGVLHEFFTLKDEITRLKEEIKALSPGFFQTQSGETIPIPEAIRNLPDDTKHLKLLLSKIFQQAQQAISAGKEYQRLSEQFQQLYEVANDYNEKLKNELENKGIILNQTEAI